MSEEPNESMLDDPTRYAAFIEEGVRNGFLPSAWDFGYAPAPKPPLPDEEVWIISANGRELEFHGSDIVIDRAQNLILLGATGRPTLLIKWGFWDSAGRKGKLVVKPPAS